MNRVLLSRSARPVVFLLLFAPAISLLGRFLQQQLGANPIEAITRETGDWTLRILLISLAITPARRLLKLSNLIRFRRMAGLFAFFYGVLHLTTYVWLDKFFNWQEVWTDLAKRPFITAGMGALAILVPLAITSTQGWIRRLGRNWQRLHRLVYFSGILGVVHYWWLVKSDIRLPAFYGICLGLLLLYRLVHSLAGIRVSMQPSEATRNS